MKSNIESMMRDTAERRLAEEPDPMDPQVLLAALDDGFLPPTDAWSLALMTRRESQVLADSAQYEQRSD